MSHKILIYQLLPRLWGNRKNQAIPYGSLQQNGCGKFADIDSAALESISSLGTTHIWFTGVISHATCEDYPLPGHHADPPEIVKGRAGSPYAIRDYYDVCPDLAMDPNHRMEEFEALIERSHHAGLKVIIDHVPNHVARDYRGSLTPSLQDRIGLNDNPYTLFDLNNDFYYIQDEALKLPSYALDQAKMQVPETGNLSFQEYPAKATGNDCFSAYPGKDDWYETVKLNYGWNPHQSQASISRTPIWGKMLDILVFWCKKGIDGFRCDMAGMISHVYWGWVIHEVRKSFPHIIFIGEIYEPHSYQEFLRAGFDYLYDKVGFYDRVLGVIQSKSSAGTLSSCWQEINHFQDHMLRFIENHDEQRIASALVCDNPRAGIPAYAAAACMHTGPVLLYFGQELGTKGDDMEGYSQFDGRTSIFDYWRISEVQAWIESGYNARNLDDARRKLYEDYVQIGRLIRQHACFGTGGFFDLQYAQDPSSYHADQVFSFIRFDDSCTIICMINFSGDDQYTRLVIPSHAFEFIPYDPHKKLIISIDEHFSPLREPILIQEGEHIRIELLLPGFRPVFLNLISTE